MAKSKYKIVGSSRFTGLNTLDNESSIQPSDSPFMLNMQITADGALASRNGFEEVAEVSGITGGFVGMLTYYRTYDTNPGDHLLCFHENGNVYEYNNTSGVFTDLGTYATIPGTITRGAVFENVAIFGGKAIQPYKWDGTTLSATSVVDPMPHGSLFTVYANRLITAHTNDSPSTAFYSEDGDYEIWSSGTAGSTGVNVGDGQDITGIIGNTDRLVIFKNNSIHVGQSEFNSTTSTYGIVKRPDISNKGGAMAPDSIQAVYGYNYFLSNKGFESYGAATGGVNTNLPFPLSLNIQPTTNQIDFSDTDKFASAFFNNKYLCSAPLSVNGGVPYIFVYDENVKRRFNVDNWVIYSGINAQSFEIFRNESKVDELYFVSPTEPKLYKFNSTYSDAGVGYTRLWRSKSFEFGERTYYRYIDLEGTKTKGQDIYVDINTDGAQVSSIAITDKNLLNKGGGGYVGDAYTGESYTGSSSDASDTNLLKFKKRIQIPDEVRFGNEMWFQVRNQAESAGWSLTSYAVIYEVDTDSPTYSYTD